MFEFISPWIKTGKWYLKNIYCMLFKLKMLWTLLRITRVLEGLNEPSKSVDNKVSGETNAAPCWAILVTTTITRGMWFYRCGLSSGGCVAVDNNASDHPGYKLRDVKIHCAPCWTDKATTCNFYYTEEKKVFQLFLKGLAKTNKNKT